MTSSCVPIIPGGGRACVGNSAFRKFYISKTVISIRGGVSCVGKNANKKQRVNK